MSKKHDEKFLYLLFISLGIALSFFVGVLIKNYDILKYMFFKTFH